MVALTWDLARVRQIIGGLLASEVEVQRRLHSERPGPPVDTSELLNRAFIALLQRRSGLRSALEVEATLQKAWFRAVSSYLEIHDQTTKCHETNLRILRQSFSPTTAPRHAEQGSPESNAAAQPASQPPAPPQQKTPETNLNVPGESTPICTATSPLAPADTASPDHLARRQPPPKIAETNPNRPSISKISTAANDPSNHPAVPSKEVNEEALSAQSW